MNRKPTSDEQINEYAKQYHDGKISQSEFYRLSKQVKEPYGEGLKVIWKEYKFWIIGVPLLIILLGVAGGIFRVATGNDFLSKENSSDRNIRLSRCAEVYNTTPTYSQRLEGEDAGVCSGFSKQEIENYTPN